MRRGAAGGVALVATAICAAAASLSHGATIAWKSNVEGYMAVASNWTGDALPQNGDTLDMRNLTSVSQIWVGDFGDERRFETMALWKTAGQLTLRGSKNETDARSPLRFQYLDYSSGNVFGLSSWLELNVSGKIKTTGDLFFAGCGGSTVVADEIEYAGGGAFMCNTSAFDTGLVVKTGKFTLSNSNLSLSTAALPGTAYGVRYVVGAGGLSFGNGATSGAFYYNTNYNKVRIDPSADYALGANPERQDNLAFMCHYSTTYFGTTDFNDRTQPRTVTFEGGIGADQLSDRNVIVDGIGTLVFNSCVDTYGHEFKGALTVNGTATLVLRDTANAGNGTKTFNSGTTLKVEQTSPNGIVELKGALALTANSTLEFVLAENSATSALKVATLALPASGTVNVKAESCGIGDHLLVENLPDGTTVDKFNLVDSDSATSARLLVADGKLVMRRVKRAVWKSNVEGNMNDAGKWVGDYIPQAGDALDLAVIASSMKNVYIPDFGDDRRFETLVQNGNIMLRSADSPITNRLRLAYLSSNSSFVLGGAAGLDVAEKLKFTGDVLCFGACSAVGVWADEFEYNGRGAFMCQSTIFANPLCVTARKFTLSGSGNLYLTTSSDIYGYGVKYVVGSGGFTFADGCGDINFYGARYSSNSVRIDPSSDYSIGVNPKNVDNLSFKCIASATTYFGTTDANDHLTPRTVTCEGGIGGETPDAAGCTIYVDGNGRFVFNSAKNSFRFPGSIQARDTATLLLRDTATASKGPMAFDAGTTFKVEQTSADGIVELGGSLALAADSTLEFVLAENSATSALKVAAFTMPASGKIKVKVSGLGKGGSATLVENLPSGMRASQFEFAEKPYEGAVLVVRENKLMVEKGESLVILIADGSRDGYRLHELRQRTIRTKRSLGASSNPASSAMSL